MSNATEVQIEEIATDLGEVYWIWKDSEVEKNEIKERFFEAATAQAQAGELAQKTVHIPNDVSADEIEDHVLKYNPGWRIVAASTRSTIRDAVIEEDPNFIQTSIAVAVDDLVDRKGKEQLGYVVTKTVASGSPIVDEVRLKNVDPALYEHVTRPRGYEWVAGLVHELGVEADEVDERIKDYLPDDWPVEIRPDLEPGDFEDLAPYTHEGPKQIKLNVRYAKKSDF